MVCLLAHLSLRVMAKHPTVLVIMDTNLVKMRRRLSCHGLTIINVAPLLILLLQTTIANLLQNKTLPHLEMLDPLSQSDLQK